MLLGVGLCVAVLAALVVAWFSGCFYGRNGVYRTLQDDTQFRRDMLEELARLEGCRLVGRE
jgi:hypothetical protein